MDHNKDITLNHKIEMYRDKNPYQKENILMGEKYVDYILQHSNGCIDFLELGIGFGRTIELLSQKFANLLVLEAEEKLISQHKQSCPNASFSHAYFEEFTTDRKFCGIGMGFVLDLVANPVELLQKYSEFLTKNGKLFVCIGNAASLHRQIAHAAGILPDIKKMSEYNVAYNHRLYKTYDEWLELFAETELKTTNKYGLFLKPFSTSQINSLNLDKEIYEGLAKAAKYLPKISNACFFVLKK